MRPILKKLVFWVSMKLLSIISFDNNLMNKVRYILLYSIGVSVKKNIFIDSGFEFINPKNLSLGKNVSFGHNVKLWAFDEIVIGDYVQTALGLTIVSGSHDIADYSPLKNQKVNIGPGCWIGANVTIIGGVNIGKGCVIGAGAVVTKDIPDYSIAGGVPAKVIKKRQPAMEIVSPFGSYSISEL